MTYVWEHAPFKASTLVLLLAIADFSNEDGIAWPSIETLSKKCRMQERNTIELLKLLEKSGWLTIYRNAGPHGVHKYQVQSLHPMQTQNVEMPKGGAKLRRNFAAEMHPNRQEPSGTVIEPSVTKEENVKTFTKEDNPWLPILAKIKAQITNASYTNWFERTEYLGMNGTTILIGVPSQVEKEWLGRGPATSMIRKTLRVSDGPTDVQFVIAATAILSEREALE